MATRIGPLVTVADLEAMPEDGNRYELIDGEIFVSRGPGLTHQRISANILVIVRRYLDENPIGEVIPTTGVIFDDYNAVIPDLILMTCERRDEITSGDRVTGAPDLAIEILSAGSENVRRDRVAKRQLYGRYGIKEYWLIDPESRTVEVYCLHGGSLELAAVLKDDDKLTSVILPDFECVVSSIFKI